MDIRTVLAFALIILIILITPYYIRWMQGSPEPPLSVGKEEFFDDSGGPIPISPSSRSLEAPPAAVPGPGETAVEAAEQPAVGAGSVSGPERHVVVETDLYEATFTTRGGRIVSWRLKDYMDQGGERLELMKPGGSGLGVTLPDMPPETLDFVPDTESLTLRGSEQAVLTLRAEVNGGFVEKRFRFQGDRYRLDTSVSVSGLPRGSKVGVGWFGGLADTEGSAGESGGFYGMSYDQIVTRAGGEVETWNLERLAEEETRPSGRVSWVAVRNKYFMAVLIPPEGERYDVDLRGWEGDVSGLPDFSVDLFTRAGADRLDYGVYVGPISYNLLRRQNRDLAENERELQLDEFIEYAPFLRSILQPIMKPFTIVILKAFLALHEVVPNYGFVIVVFSILVKIVVFPLTHKSLEAAAKMQQLQPRIKALREKYPDDQQKVSQATIKLYKEEKINPLGGCLPMFLQMPVLFSLFNVFRGSIELRQSEFILWIVDLSKPDSLPVGGFDLHVLPLTMAVSMFFQSKMTMKDPKQAMLVYIMPVFMTWIFWSMSSGLVLYFTMFNLLTLLQQRVMERTKRVLGTQ